MNLYSTSQKSDQANAIELVIHFDQSSSPAYDSNFELAMKYCATLKMKINDLRVFLVSTLILIYYCNSKQILLLAVRDATCRLRLVSAPLHSATSSGEVYEIHKVVPSTNVAE
jgi:hypothetical protein